MRPEPGGGRVRGGAGAAIRSAPEALGEADAIVICVPTPLGKSKEPDISFIVAAADGVARTLRPGTLVVLESTTYPGTTDEVLLPRMGARGLRVGEEFFLGFSPERIDPGNRTWGQIEVGGRRLKSVAWAQADLSAYDLVVVLTAHPEFEPARLVQDARLVLDTRNATGALGAFRHVIKI